MLKNLNTIHINFILQQITIIIKQLTNTMKQFFTLLAIIFSTVSYSQLTDANFQDAINECLSTNPVDGMCTGSQYGAMPDWDVSQVTNMDRAFQGKSDFNADISSWDVSNVLTMELMFSGASSFNQDLSSWNVSQVTNMRSMFRDIGFNFNSDISSWNVGQVTNMAFMFQKAQSFNQDLSSWDISQVQDATNMFREASSFNQDISSWITTNLITTNRMFYSADSFNQDISSWDVSNVTDMQFMFYSADSFNQDVSTWNVSNITNMTSMFDNSGVSTDNYDNILIGWSSRALQSNVPFGADGLRYCSGLDARQIFIDTYGWSITDAGFDCSTATGGLSTTMGYNTTASGNFSTAMGYNTTASDYGSLVIGQFNLSGSTVTSNATVFNTANTAFVIGNGSDSSNKSDAFKVLFNGDTTISNNLTVNGDVVVSSDARLKANIVSLGATLAKLLRIDGKSYTMKKDGKQKIGVLAQDIQKVFPELVTKDANEMLAVNYQGLVPVLINALKEQQVEINRLKEQESKYIEQQNLIKQQGKRLERLEVIISKMDKY